MTRQASQENRLEAVGRLFRATAIVGCALHIRVACQAHRLGQSGRRSRRYPDIGVAPVSILQSLPPRNSMTTRTASLSPLGKSMNWWEMQTSSFS